MDVVLSAAAMQQRLVDLHAVRHPEHERNAGGYVYWAPQAKAWLVVTKSGAGYRLRSSGCGSCP